MVAQITSGVATVPSARLDAEIQAAFQRILGFFDVARCALFRVDQRQELAYAVHQAPPCQDAPFLPGFGRHGQLPWMYGAVVDRGDMVSLASLDELPPAAVADARSLRADAIASALLIPLSPSPPVEYFLALASDREGCPWTAAHVGELRLLGEALVGAVERKLLEDSRQDAMRFERVIADALSAFARADLDRLDQQIGATLEELRAFAQVDQFGIFTVDQDSGWVYLAHTARAEGIPPVPAASHLSSAAPWLYDRLVRQIATLSFASVEEFPPEAAADRKLIESRGTRAGLYIPLQVGGKVRQVLAVVSSRAERSWPQRFIERLEMLGEVIVTAISRKETADARRLSESNLAEAQRIANLGSWEWDIAADQVTTSAQCDRIQGFRLTRFDDFMGAIHPDDRDAVRRQVEQELVPPYAKGPLEYRIRRPDGAVRYVRDVYEFVLGPDGTPVRVIGTIQDITEQTLMRQQVRRAQQFAQATLNAFHRCLCVIDANGVVVEVSDGWPAFAQASGWGGLATGSNYFDAVAAVPDPFTAQARSVAAGVRAVLARQQDECSLEQVFDGPAGRRHFHTKVNHFELDGTAYAAISHEDITERKNSEIELQNLRTQHWHSERVTRTGLLIASLAHELSQPLTAILSNAQAGLRFLGHGEPDLKEIGDILSDIASDDKRAGEIIESLRVMLRRQESARAPIDVAGLITEVTVLLKSEMIASGVELECDLMPGCLALIDRAQIQQVLLNLSINAIEAMATTAAGQRRLGMSVRSTHKGDLLVSVRDTGVGITQEKFKTIFDAFWTTKSRGTGMGLAISRSIIESHGGTIWVESSDGKGATFCVSLPAAAAAASSSASGQRAH